MARGVGVPWPVLRTAYPGRV